MIDKENNVNYFIKNTGEGYEAYATYIMTENYDGTMLVLYVYKDRYAVFDEYGFEKEIFTFSEGEDSFFEKYDMDSTLFNKIKNRVLCLNACFGES